MLVDTSIPQPQPLPAMGGSPGTMALQGVRSSADIVDHLDKVLKAQPPEVQAAVDHAHNVMGLNAPSSSIEDAPQSSMVTSSPVSAPDSRPLPATAPVPSTAAPWVESGSSSDMPDHRMTPLLTPSGSLSSAGDAMPLPATTAPNSDNPLLAKMKDQTAAGPGWHGIHNPFLKALAATGDVIGSGIFPEFARFVPGTTAHHNEILGEEEGQLGQEQKAQKLADDSAQSQAITADKVAETAGRPESSAATVAHLGAQTKLANQQADTLAEEGKQKPKDKYLTVPGGGLFNAETRTWERQPTDKSQLYELSKDVGEEHKVKPDEEGRYYIPVTAAGEILKTPTPKEGDDKEKFVQQFLKEKGIPDSATNRGSALAEYAKVSQAPQRAPIVNVTNQDHQEAMKGKELLDKAETQYRAAVQGANTLTDFVKSAQSGNKVTAQALPLEGALEITTTAGTKRINRTEVENYAGAGSLWDNIMGKLGKLKEGQPIPKDVQDDSIKLAKILQSNAYKTYKDAHTSAVKRYKLTGEDPLPEPGAENLPDGGGKKLDQATAQKFYDAAGGDPVKARELATQHKWVP